VLAYQSSPACSGSTLANSGEIAEASRQVPPRHLHLLAEAVAAPAGVGGVGRPLRIVVVDPAVRTVVDGEAEDRQVVGVHHPMHETHAHPVRDGLGRALAHLAEPRSVERLALAVQVRKIATNGELHQLAQQGVIATRKRQLEMAEAKERRRHPAHHRARLIRRVAVVEHVAQHRLASAHQAQRARRRHAQVMHRLAAQEFADRRAQHRASIGRARIRRRPGALELQLPAIAARRHHLAQRDRPAVAELPGPVAELVPAVIARPGLHAIEQAVAAEHLGKPRLGHVRLAETQRLRHLGRMRQQRGSRHRRGRHPRIQRAFDMSRARAGLGIAGQLAEEGVVEVQFGHAGDG
jgi:hypothetical protein